MAIGMCSNKLCTRDKALKLIVRKWLIFKNFLLNYLRRNIKFQELYESLAGEKMREA